MYRSTTHQALWRTRITLSQKDDSSSGTKLKVTEYSDLTDREFKPLSRRNSTSYKKIQGSLMSSGIKLVKRKNT